MTYVENQADAKGISWEMAGYISFFESGASTTNQGDLDSVCPSGPNKGKLVRARGVWQITDCYHPEITDAQAFDLKWSTNWTMKQMASTTVCKIQWTECRNYFKKISGK